MYPPEYAKSIPAGSNIVIQVHYSKTTGKVEKDRSSVGLYFAKAPPAESAVTSFGVINHYFKIPPGADNHEVKAAIPSAADVELFTFLPHMHLRGKDMKYEVDISRRPARDAALRSAITTSTGRRCTSWRNRCSFQRGRR